MDGINEARSRVEKILSDLERAVKDNNKEEVNSGVLDFSETMADCSCIFNRGDINKYGDNFQNILKEGEYIKK